jgi:hypothetical protein
VRRNPGAVWADEAIVRVGCARSLGSCPEAEMVGRGGEDSRQKAEKRATPGGCPLGVACQLPGRKIRSRSKGSPRATLLEMSLETRALSYSEKSLSFLGLR